MSFYLTFLNVDNKKEEAMWWLFARHRRQWNCEVIRSQNCVDPPLENSPRKSHSSLTESSVLSSCLSAMCEDTAVSQGNALACKAALFHKLKWPLYLVSLIQIVLNRLVKSGEENEECGFCLCTPCVILNLQSWLRHGQSGHFRNSWIRKRMYRKFWSMLNGRNAWSHPTYLRKKATAMGCD